MRVPMLRLRTASIPSRVVASAVKKRSRRCRCGPAQSSLVDVGVDHGEEVGMPGSFVQQHVPHGKPGSRQIRRPPQSAIPSARPPPIC